MLLAAVFSMRLDCFLPSLFFNAVSKRPPQQEACLLCHILSMEVAKYLVYDGIRPQPDPLPHQLLVPTLKSELL
jgi:hypothetical protein